MRVLKNFWKDISRGKVYTLGEITLISTKFLNMKEKIKKILRCSFNILRKIAEIGIVIWAIRGKLEFFIIRKNYPKCHQ